MCRFGHLINESNIAQKFHYVPITPGDGLHSGSMFRLRKQMDLADALIFAFAAAVDLAVLYALRRYRRWQRQRPTERVARSLAFAVRRRVLLEPALR
jgi:hypothetical protein